MDREDLTFIDWFAGIGGFHLGLAEHGWRSVAFSEIEPFPISIYQQNFPEVPNLGDITDPRLDTVGAIPRARLWTGGFPCQDLSLAKGQREGLSGSRSGLALRFIELADIHKPEWIWLENVPGLYSSNQGRDFGQLILALDDIGYDLAWDTQDAQFHGVAQRRRRVYIIAHRRDRGGSAGKVLPLCQGGEWCLAAGGKARPKSPDRFEDGLGLRGIVPQAVNSKWYRGASGPAGDEHHNLVIVPRVAETINSGGQDGGFRTEPGAHLVAYRKSRRAQTDTDYETWVDDGAANTLNAFDVSEVRATHLVVAGPADHAAGVRTVAGISGRLDGAAIGEGRAWPTLRGFGHGWQGQHWDDLTLAKTLPLGRQVENEELHPKGQDTARYKAIGNAVAVPVISSIAKRLTEVVLGNAV